MKNKILKYFLAIIFIIGLMGCSKNNNKNFLTEEEINKIVDARISNSQKNETELKNSISELEKRIKELETENKELKNTKKEALTVLESKTSELKNLIGTKTNNNVFQQKFTMLNTSVDNKYQDLRNFVNNIDKKDWQSVIDKNYQDLKNIISNKYDELQVKIENNQEELKNQITLINENINLINQKYNDLESLVTSNDNSKYRITKEELIGEWVSIVYPDTVAIEFTNDNVEVMDNWIVYKRTNGQIFSVYYTYRNGILYLSSTDDLVMKKKVN